jgi:hypothetical protein
MPRPHHHPSAYKIGSGTGTWKNSISFQQKDWDKSGGSKSEHNFSPLELFFHCNHNFPPNLILLNEKFSYITICEKSDASEAYANHDKKGDTEIPSCGLLSGFPACSPNNLLLATCHTDITMRF